MRKWLLVYALGLTVAMAVILIAGRPFRRREYRLVETQSLYERTDTVWRWDTVYKTRPQPVECRITDTFLVELPGDTVYVPLPRESRLYKDKDYTAQVSGYQATLDWIEIYKKSPTVYVEKERKPPRVGVGVALGPTLLVNQSGELHAGFGGTVGLTVNF